MHVRVNHGIIIIVINVAKQIFRHQLIICLANHLIETSSSDVVTLWPCLGGIEPHIELLDDLSYFFRGCTFACVCWNTLFYNKTQSLLIFLINASKHKTCLMKMCHIRASHLVDIFVKNSFVVLFLMLILSQLENFIDVLLSLIRTRFTLDFLIALLEEHLHCSSILSELFTINQKIIGHQHAWTAVFRRKLVRFRWNMRENLLFEILPTHIVYISCLLVD